MVCTRFFVFCSYSPGVKLNWCSVAQDYSNLAYGPENFQTLFQLATNILNILYATLVTAGPQYILLGYWSCYLCEPSFSRFLCPPNFLKIHLNTLTNRPALIMCLILIPQGLVGFSQIGLLKILPLTWPYIGCRFCMV